MKLEALTWLILFLPLLAAGVITLFTLRNKAVSATLSIGAIVTGFVLTLAVIKFGGWEARELSVAHGEVVYRGTQARSDPQGSRAHSQR